MSNKKGLSATEKQQRLLALFHETRDFYNYKELEKLASKEKGITTQSVKETLEVLIADKLAVTEKIGSGNFYWSFPSAAGAVQTKALEDSRKRVHTLEAEVASLKEQIVTAKSARKDTKERRELLARLASLTADEEHLKKELEDLSRSSVALFNEMGHCIDELKESIAFHTDNLAAAFDFFKRQGNDSAMLMAELGIPADFEELPWEKV